MRIIASIRSLLFVLVVLACRRHRSCKSGAAMVYFLYEGRIGGCSVPTEWRTRAEISQDDGQELIKMQPLKYRLRSSALAAVSKPSRGLC
jgi:hypothetical protein